MSDIAVNLVFEDILSGAVLLKLLAHSRQDYLVGFNYNASGFGWIKKRINAFNRAARGMPYLILTDLDRHECPPILIDQWLDAPRHPNLLFRIAVREVEAWLLACREAFASFMGVPQSRIPVDVEAIDNPKEFVVSLARRSRRRDIRIDIAPEPYSTAKVGPDYSGRLTRFVQGSWNPDVAMRHSRSLRKAIEALEGFRPAC